MAVSQWGQERAKEVSVTKSASVKVCALVEYKHIQIYAYTMCDCAEVSTLVVRIFLQAYFVVIKTMLAGW